MKEVLYAFPESSLPLHISLAGISYCDDTYRIVRPGSRITVVEYVFQGEGVLNTPQGKIPVGKDTVYLLPKGDDQDYYANPGNPWKKVFLNVEGDLGVALWEQLGLAGQFVFSGNGLKDIFLEIARAVACRDGIPPQEDRLLGLYTELLMRLAKREQQRRHTPEATVLRSYLDAHCDRGVGNRELAQQIFRSPDYCVKLFRREFGMTPYDYQLHRRLSLACRLLSDTALSVGEVARRVGFDDAGYFSGLFRRKIGVSPRKYKERKW